MLTNDMQMELDSKPEQPKTIIAEEESTPETFPTTEKPKEKENEEEKEEEKKNDQDRQDEKLNNSKGMEVAIMLPPPPVLVSLAEATTTCTLVDSRAPSSSSSSISMAAVTTDKDEEEVLSLQLLSARSSTPYTVHGVCCANANCGLGSTTDATSNASQWKEEQNHQLVADADTIVKEDVIDQNGVVEDHNHLNGHLDEPRRYSRSDLFDIRDAMTIKKPDYLESARLQRLNFRKCENGSVNGSGTGRNKSYRNSNPPNDLMPAFFKRKSVVPNGNNTHSIVYDTFKYSDSNAFSHYNENGSMSQHNNYRRIGSGRISTSREVNWDYIPEEDPDRHNLPEFFNTNETSVGCIQPKPQRPQKKHELDENGNYVKRVINSITGGESSFRSSASRHSINSSGEERFNSTASSSTNNRSDEPEWFSCGPTSRLDTIELCGFNDSDQQRIRSEMSSRNKSDYSNSRQEQQHSHKEKKHLAFHFDEFSTSHNGKASNGSAGHSAVKTPSSKFMPLFNTKMRDDDSLTSHNPTQSVNEFFKRSDMPSVPSANLKEKLSTTEMPSVDEIEAKWKTSTQQNNEARIKSETYNNSAENFKKILHQLNQQQKQQQQHGTGASPPRQFIPQGNANNFFNNDNLSNFIKNRNLQQQLLQRHQKQQQQQQQQAAFAQLQYNAILSRSDTQMLILSLARGEISKQGLIVQLSNPNLTQVNREAISAALTFAAAGQFHHQMAVNSNQNQIIANQLQSLAMMQQINKSPVARRNAGGNVGYQANNNNAPAGGSGSSPRSYTQEELQSHANFILHNAMLKKRLEEQNLGLQKILHLQSSMMNGGGNMHNNSRGGGGVVNDSMPGSKNFLQHHQQQQQQHQQNVFLQPQMQHQQPQRPRKTSNAGNRSNRVMGRRRSTSSSSSNTVASGNTNVHSQHTANIIRRQLEQRRNTIATVGGGPQLIIFTAVGFLSGVYIYQPLLLRYKTEVVDPAAEKLATSENTPAIMTLLKFLKEFKDSGPGVLAKAMVFTTIFVLGFRYIKPELELRRRRQAESYANYLFEIEQQPQQAQQSNDGFH